MLRPSPEKKVLLILAKMFWKTELELLKTRVCVKYFVTVCRKRSLVLIGPDLFEFDLLDNLRRFTQSLRAANLQKSTKICLN